MMKDSTKKTRGQTVIEFVFCLLILAMMMYGSVKTMKWFMDDLVQRRNNHQAILTKEVSDEVNEENVLEGPGGQLEPFFHNPLEIRGHDYTAN